MSGQVKFSSMPVALSVLGTDRVPLLVPTSGNQNQTISFEAMFDNFSVPARFTGPLIHQQTPDIINAGGVYSGTSKYALLENNTASEFITNLVNGVSGQELVLIAKTLVSDVRVTPVSPLGFTSIRFSQVGSTATLRFIDSKWVIASIHNATVS